ncbi:MAG: putative Ig domain-containing protein, partial [bacterium]|nr:putative Ig domain-containing protein [bacterium]
NVDTGDFDALGASDEWWRVWGVQPQGPEPENSAFMKACRPDYDRIGEHLGPGQALDLLDRLDDECRRREDMSRQFVVEVGSREVREGSVRTVRLAMASGQDLADAYGNRLDPGLPVGSDYQTFTVDRVRPRPVLSADVDTHDGPGPFNHFYITIDFGEPVNGTFSSRFVQLEGASRNGGWFSHGPGDRRYPLSIGPTGTGDIVVTIPAGAGVEDLAGNPNLAAEPLVIPYRPGALNLTAPPDRTFTAGVPVDVALPEAFRPPTDPTYELSGQDGAALPSWLSFDPATRRMSGTPQAAAPPVTLDYTARAGNAFRTVSFTVTVGGALSVPAPAHRTFTAGEAIQPLTLPAATGGKPPLRYALDGLPGGLEFDPDRRRLSGTPQAPGAATVTYRVTDANNAVATATFTVTVTPALVPGATLSATALTIPEGGSRTYTMVLNTRPQAEVWVMPMAQGNGLRVAPGRAVFTAANWDVPQTFTVSAAQDGDTGDETGSVGHAVHSGDRQYKGLAIGRVAVTVQDDDTVGITVSPTTLTIPEGEARTYEVRLGSRPSANVVVYVSISGDQSDGTEFICCGSSNVPFTPESWDFPRTFTVTAPQDEDADDGTLWVRHFSESADPAYHRIPIATVTAYAVDDDAGAPLTLGAPPDRAFTATRSIGTLQLPPAGGGTFRYTYGLSGQGGAALPTWLDFDPATRRMSGTPQAAAGAVTLAYTVNDGVTSVTQTFTVTVNAAPSLAAPAPQTYTAGTAIPALTLAAATGGTAPFTYALTGLPGGLSFNPASRRLTGTPQAAGASTVTYRVTDVYGASDTATFTVTVEAAAVDTNAPTVVSVERHDGANAQDELTNANSVTFRVTFSEVVQNVDTADFDASGAGDATTVTGTGTIYVVTVSGGNLATFNGAVGLTFAAGQNIQDGAGNALANTNPSGANESYTLDNTAPTVVSIDRQSSTPSDSNGLTNSDSLDFVVTFSEDVRNVDGSDFAATAGGNPTAGLLGTGAVYVVRLTGGTLANFDGTVGLTFAAGRNIQDPAGNALDATLPTGANYETYTLDNTAPTVTLTAPDDHDGSAAFNVTVTFSEDVTDFDDAADLTITSGALTSGAASITRNSATSYTANITPSGTTDVTVTAAAGAAVDGAGNASAASSTETVSYTAALSLTAPADQHWTEGEESTVNDVNLPAATGGTPPYTYAVSGLPPGVTYAAGGLEGAPTKRTTTGTNPVEYTATYTVTDDSGGTDNMAQAQFMITLYAEPAVAAQDDLTFTVGRPVDVTFGPVTGGYAPFDHQLLHWTTGVDVTLDGLTFDSTTGTLSGTPTTATSGALDVGYGVVDANFADSPFTRFNLTINAAPALAAVTDQTWPVGTPVDFDLPAATGGTAPFTYALTGTLPAGLTFNATADPPSITGTPTTAAAATTLSYTATDANGASPAAVTFDVTVAAVDTTAPTVLRIERHDGTSAQDELTRADSLQFRVTFSEAVQNVSADGSDFGASGTTGGGTGVTGSGTTRIVTVSGGDLNDYDGTVGLTFAAGQGIQDAAGNALTATLPSGASYQTYTLDNTRPTVLLAAEPGTHNGSSTINITFTFSEPVRGFVENDLTVTGATTSVFTGSDNDTRYGVTLTPSGNADATVRVQANRAQDAAGNSNAESATRTVLYLAPGAPGISVS